MKNTIKALITVALLGSFTLAHAKGEKKGFKHKIFKQLDLSKEQSAKLKTLREGKKDIKKLKSQEKDLRKEFHKALASDSDVSKLKSLHKSKVELKSKIANMKFENMLAVRAILTPEQRVKFHKLMKKNKKKHKRKRD